jgi:hypothetical protein
MKIHKKIQVSSLALMTEFYLHVYDMSKGVCKFLCPNLKGIWHTGIVAFGMEYYFANEGICACPSVNIYFCHFF